MASEQSTTWVPVLGWEGFYVVNNLGVVARLSGASKTIKPLTPRINSHGYCCLTLSKNNQQRWRTVHAIVCEAFHGPRPEGMEVAHLDGDQTNNSSSNLQWKTHADNESDKRLHGRLATGKRNGKYTKPEATPRGDAHGQAKLTSAIVLEIRRLYATGVWPSRRLAARFNTSKTNVLDIVKRRIWTHLPQE